MAAVPQDRPEADDATVMHCAHWMYGVRCCRCMSDDDNADGECDLALGEEPYGVCPDDLPATLRALTVRNPYAWAIAIGVKPVENRTRRTSHRGDIAVHAGAKWFPGAEKDPQVARAWWGGDPAGKVDPAELDSGWYRAVVAVVDLYDCHVPTPGCCDSPWADPAAGAHWLLRNVRRIVPVPAKGALGVWALPSDVARAVAAQKPA